MIVCSVISELPEAKLRTWCAGRNQMSERMTDRSSRTIPARVTRPCRRSALPTLHPKDGLGSSCGDYALGDAATAIACRPPSRCLRLRRDGCPAPNIELAERQSLLGIIADRSEDPRRAEGDDTHVARNGASGRRSLPDRPA